MLEMRFHCANGPVVLRISAALDGVFVAKNALCRQQCFFTYCIIHQEWAHMFNGRVICWKPKIPASPKPVCSVKRMQVLLK